MTRSNPYRTGGGDIIEEQLQKAMRMYDFGFYTFTQIERATKIDRHDLTLALIDRKMQHGQFTLRDMYDLRIKK